MKEVQQTLSGGDTSTYTGRNTITLPLKLQRPDGNRMANATNATSLDMFFSSMVLHFESILRGGKTWPSVSVICCQWLFFQNATQVHLHGGKNPIVLYQDLKLQLKLHISFEPAAASLQRFNLWGPPRGANCNFISWYITMGLLPPWSCTWVAFWKNSHCQDGC